MRTILIGLALAFIALPAWAQTRDQNMARCNGNDPDLSISGCTALIQSGQEPTANLVVEYKNRGYAYRHKGLYDQAIADYTHAIALSPSNGSAYNSRGLAYEAKSLHNQAIADYTHAIALNPSYAIAYNNRGNAYDAKGLHDQAIADDTRAIALNPSDADAYYNRGAAYEAKGLKDQAIADYRAALKPEPTMQAALDGLKRLGVTP